MLSRPGSVSKCPATVFVILAACLLSAAVFCNGTRQVHELPDAAQILADHQHQRPQNSTESFDGVDYKTHFLNESYSDTAVVYFWNYFSLDANSTATSVLRCHVVHPLIVSPHVYLQIIMKDNSTKTFTDGRTLGAGEPKEGGSDVWWRREKYQFDIHFNTNMSRAACLGLDSNGSWRRNEDTIKFRYGYSPTPQSNIVDGEMSKQSFIVGGYHMLECPFELKRYPNPEISWKLPSGKQPKSNRECLWFANVSSENAGQYTCMAKNKYGNATYSYQVSVREPTFMERFDRKLGNFMITALEPVSFPLGIFLMLTGFVKYSPDSGIKHFSCTWVNLMEKPSTSRSK